MEDERRDIGPRAKAMVRLLYRRAVLMERGQKLWLEKMQWPKGQERQEANEDLVLIGWELKEIEKLLPNVARTV